MADENTPTRRALIGGAGTAGVAGLISVGTPAGADQNDNNGRHRGNPNTGKSQLKGPATMLDAPFDQYDTVRIGLIGLGNRGHSMASGWAAVPGARIDAVCDIRPERSTRTADDLVERGHERPLEFGGSDESFQQMLDDVELDLVYIATPWQDHYVQARQSLLTGAHAVVELPIATELDELWDLVGTSEKTGLHLLLAENTCYGRNELSMVRAAHADLFGELTNGHGGYLHDLRELLFDDGYYTDDWRRLWHTRNNRSFYHMHGLAPICNAMDINRGDRITTMQATATEARALADYRERFVPREHRSWDETYVSGDLTTVLHGTDQGRIIRTEHDVSSPRPYSRINSVAGTQGMLEDYVPVGDSQARIYVEPDHDDHAWRPYDPYRSEFDHWLWTTIGEDAAEQGGHGGMDYLMQYRLIQTMRLGEVPDFDVYDSATWCASVPMSEMSIERGGATLEFPDFTRGGWTEHRRGIDSDPAELP